MLTSETIRKPFAALMVFAFLDIVVAIGQTPSAPARLGAEVISTTIRDADGRTVVLRVPGSLTSDAAARRLYGTPSGIGGLFETLYHGNRRQASYQAAIRELAMQPDAHRAPGDWLRSQLDRAGVDAADVQFVMELIDQGADVLNKNYVAGDTLTATARNRLADVGRKLDQVRSGSAFATLGLALQDFQATRQLCNTVTGALLLQALASDRAWERIEAIDAAVTAEWRASGVLDPALVDAVEAVRIEWEAARSIVGAWAVHVNHNLRDITEAAVDLGAGLAAKAANFAAPVAMWIGAPLMTYKTLRNVSDNWELGQDATTLATLTLLLEARAEAGALRDGMVAYGEYAFHDNMEAVFSAAGFRVRDFVTPDAVGRDMRAHHREQKEVSRVRFAHDAPETLHTVVVAGAPMGWQYHRMDPSGRAALWHGSTVKTGNNLTVLSTIEQTGTVLTGDVTGDGRLNIVLSTGNEVNIYYGDGSFVRTITLQRECLLAMLEDVDGDGVLDILLGSAGSGFSVYVYKGDGTLIQTFAGRHAGRGGHGLSIRPIAVSEGKVIVGYGAGFALTPRGVAAFDALSGNELWYYQVGPNTHYPRAASFSVADMDNNGQLDITMISATVHNGASGNGTTDRDMYLVVVDETGAGRITTRYSTPSKGIATHIFADMTGDEKSEIVGFKEHMPSYPGPSRIHIFDRSGNAVRTFQGPHNSAWAFAIGDISGNGRNEIAATALATMRTYVLDGNLNVLQQGDLGSHVRLLADLNGNGSMEIVVLTDSGQLRVYSQALTLLSTIQVGNQGGSVIASDVSENGRIELLCVTDRLYIIGF